MSRSTARYRRAARAVHSFSGSSGDAARIGLLEQAPDPDPARRGLIRRTPEGRRAHREAGLVLQGLEETLAERIGRDAVTALRAAPEAPWGPAPAPGAAAGPAGP
ncbi:hypothetical protein [Streptomyces sp. CoH17]|uniref:hypothetical protein n=1 Tax=Streptomyces sp. CoH17 TaxID=2992806 RepID=UPI00226D59D0|nr:hypothetical protein [Streptomyces sp. CoH17]